MLLNTMHLSFVSIQQTSRTLILMVFAGHDAIIQPDQGRPAIDLINQLLKSATGAAIVGKQRVRVRRLRLSQAHRTNLCYRS